MGDATYHGLFWDGPLADFCLGVGSHSGGLDLPHSRRVVDPLNIATCTGLILKPIRRKTSTVLCITILVRFGHN